MLNTNEIILVDKNGKETGVMDKMEAHQLGELHRAFSIFIVNRQGHLLLQQRADIKYHSGGLWSNTCCSHPAPGEKLIQAAHRRLKEELNFDCNLKEIFSFTYRADVGNGLIEHEQDHVLIGSYDGIFHPNPREIQACRWISLAELVKDISSKAHSYTDWLKFVVNLKLPELTTGIERLNHKPGLESPSTK